ncbi:MAG: ATP-binding protein [Gemmatimonadales bacterium]
MSHESLLILLRALGLSVMERECTAVLAQAERENWGYQRCLQHLAELELAERLSEKVTRLLKQAKVPAGFSLSSLEQTKLPEKPRRQLPTLLSGDFVRRGDNLLCFGLPGRGKSHYIGAIARDLIQQHQMKVLFVPAFKLVAQLLVAKNQLKLPALIEQLGRFDLICCDDIGYIQHSAEEMEVLFTFLAERYQQQKSLAISSNLVFSEWDRIFKNPMTAMAAIDRLIHRAIILEFAREKSYREEAAEERQT